MAEIVRIENLHKKFGDVTALENVNLSMEKGKIYGIIGRNGSGKTVLFKLITGFLKPTKGAGHCMRKRDRKGHGFCGQCRDHYRKSRIFKGVYGV